MREGITAAELRRRSPYRIPRVSPWQWLKRLFPAGSLLCLSREEPRGVDSQGVPVFFGVGRLGRATIGATVA